MKINDVLKYNDLFTHCSLVGSTGSGKTTFLLSIINNVITQNNTNNTIVFIDGKNDFDLVKQLALIAKTKDYQFLHFSNQNPKINTFNYLPLHNKSILEDKEILQRVAIKETSSASLGATYYLNLKNKLIDLILEILHQLKIPFTFLNLIKYSNKQNLLNIIQQTQNENFIQTYNNQVLYTKNESFGEVQDFFKDISYFVEQQNLFSLKDLLKTNQKQIILFSLDFLTYPAKSKDLAQMICLDLRQSINIKSKNHDLFFILDEFGSYINSDLKTILEQGRSYKVSCLFSYQSLGQININNFKNILFDNTNSWLIFNNKHNLSLKELASLFGFKKTFKLNYSLDLKQKNLLSNKGSIIQEDTYVVSPDEIRNLTYGQCFIKTPTTKAFYCKKLEK